MKSDLVISVKVLISYHYAVFVLMKSPVASNKYYVSSTEIKSKLLQAEVCDLFNFRNIASSVKSTVLLTLSMLDAWWICPRAYFEPSQTSKMQLSAIIFSQKTSS